MKEKEMKPELKKSKAPQSSAKAEPLKGKGILMKLGDIPNIETFGDFNPEIRMFPRDNIKSAVEWLKDEVITDIQYDFPAGLQTEKTRKLWNLIDKAFEDVMK